MATDISFRAVEIAKANAERCGVENVISFFNGDLLDPINGSLHIVVANITTTDCKLYPASSDTIEGGSANAAVTLPAKTTFTLTCKDATDWVKHRGLAVYNSSGTLLN